MREKGVLIFYFGNLLVLDFYVDRGERQAPETGFCRGVCCLEGSLNFSFRRFLWCSFFFFPPFSRGVLARRSIWTETLPIRPQRARKKKRGSLLPTIWYVYVYIPGGDIIVFLRRKVTIKVLLFFSLSSALRLVRPLSFYFALSNTVPRYFFVSRHAHPHALLKTPT